MRHLFLPAVLPTTLADRWGMSPLNWLDQRVRGRDGHYPNALLSHYHWRAERRLRLADDVFIFGDSGGFSVATQGAFIDPLDAILWQLKHCDVGPILDHPPARIAGVHHPDGDAGSDWDESLHLTVLSIERALPHYLEALEAGSRFRLWGVVHGETDEQLEEWHRRISDVYPFTEPGEGWAFKAFRPKGKAGVARCLRCIESHRIRRAHFFGTGGVPAVVTLFCLGPEAGLEFLSYDASTPIKLGYNRALLIPTADSLGWRTIVERFSDTGETPARNYMRDRCPCLSCQFLREDLEECPEVDDEYFKYRMTFHNVLAALRVFDALFEASKQDSRGLLREKLGKDYKKTMRAFRPS